MHLKAAARRITGYGAHVDDSTAFQVYQNLAEQGQTTQAVRRRPDR